MVPVRSHVHPHPADGRQALQGVRVRSSRGSSDRDVGGGGGTTSCRAGGKRSVAQGGACMTLHRHHSGHVAAGQCGRLCDQEQGQRARGMASHGKWECVGGCSGHCTWTWALLPVSVCPWPQLHVYICMCVWQFHMVPGPAAITPSLHPFSHTGLGHRLTP